MAGLNSALQKAFSSNFNSNILLASYSFFFFTAHFIASKQILVL